MYIKIMVLFQSKALNLLELYFMPMENECIVLGGPCSSLKIQIVGGGDRAQWLRVCTTLLEDLSSDLSTQIHGCDALSGL